MSSLLSTMPDTEVCTAYFRGYMVKAPSGNILDSLKAEGEESSKLLSSLTEQQWNFSYARGKWTIRELVAHCIDTERIFATRALCLARGEKANLFGFEPDPYIEGSDANQRSSASFLDEWTHLRAANLALFRSLPEASWTRVGQVDGNPMQAIAVPWILCGHSMHHMEILRHRYV